MAPTELPSSGFPGATANASNAAWPSKKQPDNLAEWKRSIDGQGLAPCWSTKILRKFPEWPAKCLGLTEWTSGTADTHAGNLPLGTVDLGQCEAACKSDPTCGVWQYVDGKCFRGLGHSCVERSGETDFAPSGGQRIQHGKVRVLKDMKSTWVFGLKNEGKFGNGTAEDDAERCKHWCYSNTKCQYWQYGGPDGCWVEDPDRDYKAQYPLTSVIDVSSAVGSINASIPGENNPARLVIRGEYIQHYCPPQRTELAPISNSTSMTKNALIAVACLGLIMVVCVVVYCTCADRRAVKRKVRGLEKKWKAGPEASPSTASADTATEETAPLVIEPPHLLIPMASPVRHQQVTFPVQQGYYRPPVVPMQPVRIQ